MTFFSHVGMPCNKFSPNLMWKYQIIPFIFLRTTRSRVSSKNRSVPPNSILCSSSSLWPPTPAHASVSLLLSSSSSAVCFVLISSLSSFLRPLMLLASFLSSAVRRTLPLLLLLLPSSCNFCCICLLWLLLLLPSSSPVATWIPALTCFLIMGSTHGMWTVSSQFMIMINNLKKCRKTSVMKIFW